MPSTSSMFEQVVIDAEALREVALKNAEEIVVEKYADEIKKTMDRLLEQGGMEEEFDPSMGMGDEMGMTDPSIADNMPLGALDDEEEPLCKCPESDEEIDIDFNELSAAVDAMDSGDMMGAEDMVDREGAAEEMMGPPGEEGQLPPGEEEEEEEEEYNLRESDLDDLTKLLEDLKVDIEPKKSGWAGMPEKEMQVAQEQDLARQFDTEVREEMEKMRKAVKSLEEKLNKKTAENKHLIVAIKELRTKAENLALQNAKLLYTNKTLTNNSLNERQKKKIAESLLNVGSLEEAQTIYETLESTVGSTNGPARQPESLREVINKASPLYARPSRNTQEQQVDPMVARWQKVAGINK